jgi:ankyrin repeat protein
MLLDNDVDVDKADKWGRTPLIEACMHGARDCAILLIEADADPNSVTDTYLSPLMLAVRRGHEDILRTLLKHDDIKVVSKVCSSSSSIIAQGALSVFIHACNIIVKFNSEFSRIRRASMGTHHCTLPLSGEM